MKSQSIISVGCLLLAVCAVLSAQERKVNFSVEVERTVPANLMIAHLLAFAQEAEIAQASQQVNADVAWVAEQIAEFPDLEMKEVSYQSQPLYSSQTTTMLSGWEVRQTLLVQSRKRKLLSEVLPQLQSRVALVKVEADLTEAAADKLLDDLTTTALLKFQHRAELITKILAAAAYEIDSLSISSHRPNLRAPLSALPDYANDMVAPAMVKGEKKFSLQATGSILLRP